MTLKELIKDIEKEDQNATLMSAEPTDTEVVEIIGNLDIEIKDLQNDSRLINKKGSLFFAIKGFLEDGSKYIPEAINRGATAIILDEDCEFNLNIRKDITVVKVKNARKMMAYISKKFYGDPTSKLITIGVTGSKGKTSVSFILQRLLMALGYKVGVIGTIGAYIDGKFFMQTEKTSPESFITNYILSEMIKQGVQIVILEISSQTINTERIVGIKLDYSCFTNFSEDHISSTEHKSMEEYFDAKIKIAELADTIILNNNDKKVLEAKNILKNMDSREINDSKKQRKKIITFGSTEDSDIRIYDDTIKYDKNGTEFEIEYEGIKKKYKTNLLGKINVENIACSIALASSFGLDTYMIEKEIQNIKLPSRFEFIENNLGITIVIDYAHTEVSLREALKILKSLTKGKLIAVWGLGGDRDLSKRPLMGKVSGELADFTILTSKDPRFEDPENIAKEIAAGIKEVRGQYEIIVDRKEAVLRALDMAKPGDTVALIGQGEDTTLDMGYEKIPYSEHKVVREYLDINKST